MKKTSHSPHWPLPEDTLKRLDMVVAACSETGYIDRDVLANYYKLTPLQASILLREFLTHHVRDVRPSATYRGYILKSDPTQKINNDEH